MVSRSDLSPHRKYTRGGGLRALDLADVLGDESQAKNVGGRDVSSNVGRQWVRAGAPIVAVKRTYPPQVGVIHPEHRKAGVELLQRVIVVLVAVP